MKIDEQKVEFQKTGERRIFKKFPEDPPPKNKFPKDHKERPGVRKTLDFSVSVLEMRGAWNNFFKTVKIIVILEFYTHPNQNQV